MSNIKNCEFKTSTIDKVIERQTKITSESNTIKFAVPDGTAELITSKDAASLTYKSNGIFISPSGTIIDGLVHFAREPEHYRFNTFWKLNNELLTGLPSTNYTPIPVLVYDYPPVVKFYQSIMSIFSKLG